MAQFDDSTPRNPTASRPLAAGSTPLAARVLVAVAAFAAVLAAGLGWRIAAVILGGLAVVGGVVLLRTPPRPRPGTGWALTGVAVGVATLVLVPLLAGPGPLPGLLPVSEQDDSATVDGGRGEDTAPILSTVDPTTAEASDTAPGSTDGAGNPVDFSAYNLVDDDLATAWRVPADGVEEGVVFTFAGSTHLRRIGLTAGYSHWDPATGEDLFWQNRRLERVTFLFDDGSERPFTLDPTRRDLQYCDVDVTATRMAVRIDATTSAPLDFTAVSDIDFWAQD
jgi:hypothetical protein